MRQKPKEGKAVSSRISEMLPEDCPVMQNYEFHQYDEFHLYDELHQYHEFHQCQGLC